MSLPIQVHMYDEQNDDLGCRIHEHHVPAVGDYISLRDGTSRKVEARIFIYITGCTQVSIMLGKEQVD